MQILVEGVLIDPTGNPLPKHKIKITSRSNDSASFVESNSVELTNDLGEYSFILTEGWKYIEVLFNNTYILTGDVLVNDGTPTPINLTDLIDYSTPVEPSDIYTLPSNWDNLQNTLEQGTFTHKRERRDQLVDTLTHIVKLGKVYVSDDELERSASETNEVSSCDAKVIEDSLTYSDDVGNSYVHSSKEVSNKNGTDKSRTLVGSDLIKNTDVTLGGFSESNVFTISTNGSSKVSNTIYDNLTKTSNEVINTGFYSYIEDYNTNDYLNRVTLGQLYKDEVSISNSLNTKTYLSKVGTKELVEEYFNDGTNRTKTITLDNFKVGREGNTLFEVDNELNRVTVRGSLRITDIEDQDGNPIDLPKDGNTIFQVFRYGETSNGPWEDILQSYHLWKQENTSVNGYINPNGWSEAYKFKGEDGVGSSGDTIYVEYNYSPDGSTSWTTEMKAGDAFRRERTVTNDVAGDWSDPARIKGINGDEIEIRSQYSIDGISNWHDNLVDGDIYERRARFVNGVIDSPWSDPFRIIGKDGEPGIPGLNGSGWYSIVGNNGVWPGDTQAVADFINTFGRVPQLDDHLFYVNADPNPTQTDGRRCITPVGDSPIQWNNPRAYFDGDVIVKGTLSADRLVAQSVTGNEIDSQTTIIAGSGSTTAGMNGYDLATLPAWMGGGSNPYAGYRFWAGATNPAFANFKVDSNGIAEMVGAKFSTSASNERVEIQDDGTYLIWAGNGTKNDINGLFWIKSNGTGFIKGDFFQGEIIATVSATNSGLGSSLSATSGSYISAGKPVSINFSQTLTVTVQGDTHTSQDFTCRVTVKRGSTTIKTVTIQPNRFNYPPSSGGQPGDLDTEAVYDLSSFVIDNITTTGSRTYTIESVSLTSPTSPYTYYRDHEISLYAQENKLA